MQCAVSGVLQALDGALPGQGPAAAAGAGGQDVLQLQRPGLLHQHVAASNGRPGRPRLGLPGNVEYCVGCDVCSFYCVLQFWFLLFQLVGSVRKWFWDEWLWLRLCQNQWQTVPSENEFEMNDCDCGCVKINGRAVPSANDFEMNDCDCGCVKINGRLSLQKMNLRWMIVIVAVSKSMAELSLCTVWLKCVIHEFHTELLPCECVCWELLHCTVNKRRELLLLMSLLLSLLLNKMSFGLSTV